MYPASPDGYAVAGRMDRMMGGLAVRNRPFFFILHILSIL